MERLSGNELKIIAGVTMLIDHIAYALYLRGTPLLIMSSLIGRVAFPLFAFLLVEGFLHTRNRGKYISCMLLLALISEVPYDCLLHKRVLEYGNQNILFLLSLSLCMFCVLDWIRSRKNWHFAAALALQALVVGLTAFLANLLRLDYGISGILMLATIFYVCVLFDGATKAGSLAPAPGRRALIAIVAGVVVLNIAFLFDGYYATPGAFLAAVPAAFYNGTRGKLKLKYLFYAYYPAHLTALFFILRAIRPRLFF